MIEYLKVSKVKNFIVAESNKQHQLGKPLVKALNELIDRTLATSVTQATHDKQSRLETPSLINKQLAFVENPKSKTKPDLPFLHLTRLKERIEKLSQGKISASNQFVDKLNNLLLAVLLSTIGGTVECRINQPVLVSGSQDMPAAPEKRVAQAEKTPICGRRPLGSVVAAAEPEPSVDGQQPEPSVDGQQPEPSVDGQQPQRQTKTVKIGLHLSKSDLTATCQFFTIRDIAKIETTVRERIFKGLLDSGFALDDLEQQIQIEVEVDDKKR